MIAIAKKTLVAYGVILGVSAVLYFFYLIHAIILQLVIALLLALALEPLVGWLERRGLSRIWAIVTSVFLAFIAFVLVVSAIATPLITQGSRLINNAPQIVDQIANNSHVVQWNTQYHVVDKAREYAQRIPVLLAGASLPAVGIVTGVIGGISSVAIILILALFLMIEGPKGWQSALALMKPSYANRIDIVGRKMALSVSGFVSGNLFISLIAGVVTLVTLLIARVPYAFALATLVALFDLIPLIGAALATIVVALVALTQGVVVTIVVVVVLLVYQFIEGHFIQTIVYSRSVALSPLLIILASIIGAELGGVIGVLLAIPLAGVAQIAIIELFTLLHHTP